MHSEPNVDERALHEINNFAYAAWCEACLMAKGRTEPHRTNPKHLTRREYSTMNFNFSFTGHDCPQMPSRGDAVKPEETLIALNLSGSQSGCVFSTPVRNRSDVHSRKMITILQFVTHPKVALKCDPEPVLLKLQSFVLVVRQKFVLEILIENSSVADPGSNAWVDKAGDEIKQQATTSLAHLELKLNLSITNCKFMCQVCWWSSVSKPYCCFCKTIACICRHKFPTERLGKMDESAVFGQGQYQ